MAGLFLLPVLLVTLANFAQANPKPEAAPEAAAQVPGQLMFHGQQLLPFTPYVNTVPALGPLASPTLRAVPAGPTSLFGLNVNNIQWRGHIPRGSQHSSPRAVNGFVTMQMNTGSGCGSTGNHRIRIRQDGKQCFTSYLTTGPWCGETYEADICMRLDMDKCITFEIHNDSYYDPSSVRRVRFEYNGKIKSRTWPKGSGWFHSAYIPELTAC